jgi:alpha-L-rhamnosidase
MSTPHVTRLRCEYLTNPLGIDVKQPRLSWELRDERRGARQTAYQIQVASSQAALDQADLWDSGQVTSDQSIHVRYEGAALGSGQRAWWRVRVWDADGQPSEWSEAAWWEMGLLDRSDWQAEWLQGMLAGGPRTSSPVPFFRTTFTLDKPVASARLYASALGVYEPHLNGRVVGDDVLAPGWTDYAIRVQYQAYDVTEQLRQGENVLGAIVGDGWYCGYISWIDRQRYGDRPRFLAQLQITFEDGSQQTIVTNTDWKACYGPILESDMQMGESYDARQELRGWDAPGYDDSRWLPIETFDPGEIELNGMRGPTVKRIRELTPISDPRSHSHHHGTRWIFDMGQNMVGWVRLKISGPAGTTITLRFAEVLNPDGSLYTENLRRARNIDQYTLRGEGEEVWEPRFVFHGFRYVEVIGYPGKQPPPRDLLTGIVIHSEMEQTGTFHCSNPLLNQLQHNIEWGQRGNFVDVPTDCPQRDERLGWTGDAQVFISTAAFNMDVAGFFTKWLRDLEDAQSPDGDYPKYAPAFGEGANGGPAWSDAGTICPWTIYQVYGDTSVLAERYASMQRFIAFLETTSKDGRRNYPGYPHWQGFGDWLALDGSVNTFGITSKELLGTAFFAHSARLMSQIAEVLGKTADAKRYQKLFERVRKAFQNHFITPDGLLAAQTQTAYVLALHFDLMPEELRPQAAAELVRDIRQRGNLLSTGFVGTPYLNFVLSETGHLDVAYDLLLQTRWPSWLYSVTQGATTIWERWDGWTHDRGFQSPGMNSFNHYAYGAIGAWMYAVVAGIALDPQQPGYRHIIMRPRPGGGLSNVSASLRSMYGLISSAWTLKGDAFDWEIAVPCNTTATVFVPVKEGQEVFEGSVPAEQAEGVELLRREADVAVYEVVAGRYHFHMA